MTINSDDSGVLIFIPRDEINKETLRIVDIEVIKKEIQRRGGNFEGTARDLGYTKQAFYNRFGRMDL